MMVRAKPLRDQTRKRQLIIGLVRTSIPDCEGPDPAVGDRPHQSHQGGGVHPAREEYPERDVADQVKADRLFQVSEQSFFCLFRAQTNRFWIRPQRPVPADAQLASCKSQYMTRRKLTDAFKDRLGRGRSEEHTSELQSLAYLVCRLLLEKKK